MILIWTCWILLPLQCDNSVFLSSTRRIDFASIWPDLNVVLAQIRCQTKFRSHIFFCSKFGHHQPTWWRWPVSQAVKSESDMSFDQSRIGQAHMSLWLQLENNMHHFAFGQILISIICQQLCKCNRTYWYRLVDDQFGTAVGKGSSCLQGSAWWTLSPDLDCPNHCMSHNHIFCQITFALLCHLLSDPSARYPLVLEAQVVFQLVNMAAWDYPALMRNLT